MEIETGKYVYLDVDVDVDVDVYVYVCICIYLDRSMYMLLYRETFKYICMYM
jgi:hypothetical protein